MDINELSRYHDQRSALLKAKGIKRARHVVLNMRKKCKIYETSKKLHDTSDGPLDRAVRAFWSSYHHLFLDSGKLNIGEATGEERTGLQEQNEMERRSTSQVE